MALVAACSSSGSGGHDAGGGADTAVSADAAVGTPDGAPLVGDSNVTKDAAPADQIVGKADTGAVDLRPMIIASQGHDFKDLVPAGQSPGAHEGILSGEAGGAIKQEGNLLDAFSQSWFDPKVDTGNGSSGAYNNFDGKLTANAYPCALDPAADGAAKALAYAGRLGN